jgi:hypothetical protein
MIIIGCDFHTRYQQIAVAEETTGELLLERRLDHESGEAHTFYRNLGGWTTLYFTKSAPPSLDIRRVGPPTSLPQYVRQRLVAATNPLSQPFLRSLGQWWDVGDGYGLRHPQETRL